MLDEKFHTQPFKFFLTVSKGQIKWLVFNIIFYSAGCVSILAASYYLGRTVDDLTLNSGVHAKSLLLLVALLIIAYEFMYRVGHIFEVVMASNIRANIKKALFGHTSSLSFGYFADQFAGEIAHKVATTANAYERMIFVTTNGFIESAVLAVTSSILLGAVNIYYALFIIVWSTFFLIGSLLLAKEMGRRAGVFAVQEAKTTGNLVDVYGNIGAVKVYGKSEHLKSAQVQIDSETKAYRSMGIWNIFVYNFQGVSIILLSLGLILISAKLYGQSLITLGQIVFVSAAALRMFNYIWEMGRNVTDFIRYRGESAQNLNDLIVAPAIVDGDHTAEKIHKQVTIEYCNVTFKYGTESLVLDNFSITIKPGEKVGIVGLSGAGKTTFVNLLLRFFDPQSGAIFLNGQDIRNFTQESLRAHISHISQDTSLFHASIAKNIAYGSPAVSLLDIKRAAELAYADEFVGTLPQGYQSVVGERGIKLSGGQRQRIAIARAILADRPLFLLDEATSALDSDSEAKIQKGLAALMENKTVIAVAHRLSTLSRMDRIIYLENGKILEDGAHNQLLLLNGKYARLWHMQAGGFLMADEIK